MSKTRESSLWGWLRDGTKTYRPLLDMSRVENTVDEGTPDVEGCYDGEQFWCELKSLTRPIKPATAINLEVDVEQVRWHRRRSLAGGRTWFLIQVGSGMKASRYLIPGYRAMKLEEKRTEAELESLAVIIPGANARNLLKMMGK